MAEFASFPEALSDRLLDVAELHDAARADAIENVCNDFPDHKTDIVAWFDQAGGDVSSFIDMAGASPQAEIRTIGPYRVLELLGKGGFGSVYRAEKSGLLRRQVAIKVLHLGMNSREILARFDAERQALAMMDHPNIARVVDAGIADSGQSYFVMEFVRGDNIVEYCDKNRLNNRQRLELFAAVCQAVHHAHQKGIVHRDLKPSNILVTTRDGQPAPKIIDFGIAKSINQPLTAQTVFTRRGQIIGTIGYMSPEQADSSSIDVDTMSDIYSLGVILFELLTGTLPVTRDRLKNAGLQEMIRILHEEEPEKPSTRIHKLESLGVDLKAPKSDTTSIQAIAEHRRTNPSTLANSLRGELDWIVLKALDKDRNRRYESPRSFANDIERYLQDDVVHARPPSAGYRLQKLVRRHKIGFAAATVTVIALLAGTALAVYGAIQSADAAELALGAQREAETARDDARDEAERSTAISRFLQDAIAYADPDELRSGEFDPLVFVEQTSELFGDAPEVQAAALTNLAILLESGGHLETASGLLSYAVESWRTAVGHDQPVVASTLSRQGIVQLQLGDVDAARATLQRALEIARRRSTHTDSILIDAQLALAEIRWQHDHDPESAETLLLGAVDELVANRKARPKPSLRAAQALTEFYFASGAPEEGGTHLLALIEQYGEFYGATSPLVADLAFEYGERLSNNGLESLACRVMESAVPALNALSPSVRLAESRKLLASLLSHEGRHEEAQQAWLDALATYRTVLSDQPELMALETLEYATWEFTTLGEIVSSEGRLVDAIAHAQSLGVRDEGLVRAMHSHLMYLLVARSSPALRSRILDIAHGFHEVVREVYANDHRARATHLSSCADVYDRIGEKFDSRRARREANFAEIEAREQAYGPSTPLLCAKATMSEILGRPEDAAQFWKGAIELLPNEAPAWRRDTVRLVFAGFLLRTGSLKEAHTVCDAVLQQATERRDSMHPLAVAARLLESRIQEQIDLGPNANLEQRSLVSTITASASKVELAAATWLDAAAFRRDSSEAVPFPDLVNPGFEVTQQFATPEGWTTNGTSARIGYMAEGDIFDPYTGQACLKISGLPGSEVLPEDFRGSVFQSIDSTRYQGQRIRVSAQVRTNIPDSSQAGIIRVRTYDEGGELLGSELLTIHEIGHSDWQRQRVEISVEDSAVELRINFIVVGSAQLWADELAIEVVAS